MRPMSFEVGVLAYPAGSCLVSFGNTKVLCAASIEEGVPPFIEQEGEGWLTAEYAMLPASVPEGRKRRERDSRAVEIQRFIGRSLRAALDRTRLGPYTIVIDCDVLQADGGTRTAAISGGWVALYQALEKLAELHGVEGPEYFLAGQVAAVSVGIVEGQLVADLDFAHDLAAQVDMNVVMCDDRLVEVQGNGEKGAFTREELDAMLDLAAQEIGLIYEAQRAALGLA
ncbi:ribonuclease PH [Spirochaeta thermophila]|nr:ribonuclease PH [Spirochaeta thermophila]